MKIDKVCRTEDSILQRWEFPQPICGFSKVLIKVSIGFWVLNELTLKFICKKAIINNNNNNTSKE